MCSWTMKWMKKNEGNKRRIKEGGMSNEGMNELAMKELWEKLTNLMSSYFFW